MSAQQHTAKITVERNDELADYDGYDQYSIAVRNPVGEHPHSIWSDVEEYVRENADLSLLRDGETKEYGQVTYTADEIVDKSIHSDKLA